MYINEVFRSIQGEGLNVGRFVVFVRFQGCNVTPAFSCYKWCDTKYSWSQKSTETIDTTADRILTQIKWVDRGAKWVILTGGEPLLQYEDAIHLARVLHMSGYYVGLETNGTIQIQEGDDTAFNWVTVSPKTFTPYFDYANEIKLVINESTPASEVEQYLDLNIPIVLQPRDNNPECVQQCMSLMTLPDNWKTTLRLIPQVHKLLGLR